MVLLNPVWVYLAYLAPTCFSQNGLVIGCYIMLNSFNHNLFSANVSYSYPLYTLERISFSKVSFFLLRWCLSFYFLYLEKIGYYRMIVGCSSLGVVIAVSQPMEGLYMDFVGGRRIPESCSSSPSMG